MADLDDGALARRIAEAGRAPDAAAESERFRRRARRVRLYAVRPLRDAQGAQAHGGEGLFIPAGTWLKALPTVTVRKRRIAVGETGERPLGEYTFVRPPQ